MAVIGFDPSPDVKFDSIKHAFHLDPKFSAWVAKHPQNREYNWDSFFWAYQGKLPLRYLFSQLLLLWTASFFSDSLLLWPTSLSYLLLCATCSVASVNQFFSSRSQSNAIPHSTVLTPCPQTMLLAAVSLRLATSTYNPAKQVQTLILLCAQPQRWQSRIARIHHRIPWRRLQPPYLRKHRDSLISIISHCIQMLRSQRVAVIYCFLLPKADHGHSEQNFLWSWEHDGAILETQWRYRSYCQWLSSKVDGWRTAPCQSFTLSIPQDRICHSWYSQYFYASLTWTNMTEWHDVSLAHIITAWLVVARRRPTFTYSHHSEKSRLDIFPQW